jgi:uncharacterized YccA/Bax inhibitor family protein
MFIGNPRRAPRSPRKEGAAGSFNSRTSKIISHSAGDTNQFSDSYNPFLDKYLSSRGNQPLTIDCVVTKTHQGNS